MPELRLIPIDRRQKKVAWLFNFDGHGATVFSADQPMIYFPHEMASHRIILPSFWENIEHLGIVADDGNPVWFVVEKETVAKIRAYLNWTLAIQGSQPLQGLKKKAKTCFIWGLTCLLLGLLVLIFGPLEEIVHHLALAVCVVGVVESARWFVKRRKIKEVQQIQVAMAKDEL